MPPRDQPHTATLDSPLNAAILDAVSRTWGFHSLRPLQGEAIRAVLERRDSLVVLPTGGGKSLCYQVPPLVTGRMTLVVSPLISLMKDQVDGLRLSGYPAAALHSGLSLEEQRDVRAAALAGQYRLLFVSPERLLTDGFLPLVRRMGVATFAIDEAHCISQWGHDFRPEYRRLACLRELFPEATFHAYTATATPRVRRDIADQLKLRNHAELVGRFDRPNLTYRILPRVRLERQLVETLRRHEGQAAIVYCITRRETETIAGMLTRAGIPAEPYHAGLSADQRHRVQEDFSSERLNVVVATVAFGMGIDRSDVRCVVHAAMPKSVEHYQQETGRAGRDGLPAECVLFYSAADVQRWKGIIETAAAEADVTDDESLERMQGQIMAQLDLLGHMHRLCTSARCRHAALSEYFGQKYEPPRGSAEPAGNGAPVKGCGACDVCLGELDTVPDSTVVAQKIVSCVARASLASGVGGWGGGGFGVAHIVDVLRGKASPKIVERGHHQLSTFGLLKDVPRETLISYVNQLIDEGVLERTHEQYPVLRLTAASADLLRGKRQVTLVSPRRPDDDAWAGAGSRRGDDAREPAAPLTDAERGLFESLRALRRIIADGLGVPPYVVFSDATLEELARVRPGSEETFINVRGVGNAKLAQFGERFIAHIRAYCEQNNLALDALAGSRPRTPRSRDPERPGPLPPEAAAMFRRGESIDDVAAALGRTPRTVAEYLCRFIAQTRPANISPWVDDRTYRDVAAAARELGTERLRPIFDRLAGRVPYETIKLVLTHLETTTPS